MDELSRIASKIEALADAELSTGQPYLLSKLGMDIGSDLQTIKKEEKSLANFVRKRFSDKYEIIFTGQFRNIQSLIKRNSQELASLITDATTEKKDRKFRFNYRFWAAFSVPVVGSRRFVNLDDFTFEDVDAPPSPSYVAIDSEYITPDTSNDRDKVIYSKIISWIEDNKLETEQFLSKPRTHISPFGHQRTLLHAIVDALDKRQLATVSLPMDVIVALMNKNV
ncbi:hypothetical protein [Ochrobactrum sp. RH2CCR150]|uniref:hypothetical protein n=1 Tax=Ochrobactrum sp. RH2CCR150 TaxID=2587044 RepID=UPI0015FD08D3|nr:hypothetical protein [Ochrobactrum sp. RH2CCR150]